MDDDGFPGGVWFGGGLIATGKIGESVRAFKGAERVRSAGAIRAVTCDARGFVNLFAGIELESCGCARLGQYLEGSASNQQQSAKCQDGRLWNVAMRMFLFGFIWRDC